MYAMYTRGIFEPPGLSQVLRELREGEYKFRSRTCRRWEKSFLFAIKMALEFGCET